jgi:P27 family predicted phage terminase small subunit
MPETQKAAKRPSAPSHLSGESRALWLALIGEYEFEPADEKVLLIACEALDRLRMAQAEVSRDGVTVPDRYGSRKTHPALLVEGQARTAFLAAMRQLNLEDVAQTLSPHARASQNRWER